MAVVCKICGREYDITLFEFGTKVRCDCGNIVDLKIKNLNKFHTSLQGIKTHSERKRVILPKPQVAGYSIKVRDKIVSKEIEEVILVMLEKAEDFYIPVKMIWKELNSQGYQLPKYKDYLNYLKKNRRLKLLEFKEEGFEDGEEMDGLGYYSGPRVKLKKRKISKEDMQRIILRHAQNVIDNLIKAYQVKPEDLPPEKEDELIELMRRAKKLKEKISEAFKKKISKECLNTLNGKARCGVKKEN